MFLSGARWAADAVSCLCQREKRPCQEMQDVAAWGDVFALEQALFRLAEAFSAVAAKLHRR